MCVDAAASHKLYGNCIAKRDLLARFASSGITRDCSLENGRGQSAPPSERICVTGRVSPTAYWCPPDGTLSAFNIPNVS